MSQYFSNDFSLKNDNFIINYEILGKNLTFYSNNGVFSKNRIDKGSDIFIKYLLTLNLVGKVLDYGSGIGIIGICLNLFFKELDVTYCDVNYRCLELNKQNLKKYDLNGLIVSNDELSKINDEIFDYVFLNSPIRSGKDNIYKMYKESYRLLKNNGEFYVIIRKDKGMLSHKAFLETIFNEVTIVYKEKGYFIIKMVKK